MDNYLNEGLIEKIDNCEIYQDKPLVFKDKHFDDRLFSDRKFVDLLKTPQVTTKTVQNHLLNQTFKKCIPMIQSDWQSKNTKFIDMVNNNIYAETTTQRFVIRDRYNFVCNNPKTGRDFHFVIEVALNGIYGDLFTSKHMAEVKQAFQDGGVSRVNDYYATLVPQYATQIRNGDMGFFNPYFTIQTAVIGFISPSRFPTTFWFVKDDPRWFVHNNVCNKKEYRVDYNNYKTAINHARNLKDMKGLVNVRESTVLRDLLILGDDYDRL